MTTSGRFAPTNNSGLLLRRARRRRARSVFYFIAGTVALSLLYMTAVRYWYLFF